MYYQRFLGLLLVFTTAFTLGYAAQQALFPVAVSCLAVIGYTDRFYIRLTPFRRTLALLIISLAFAIQYRYMNIGAVTPGFIHDSRWYPAARYFLVIFAAQFFFYRKNELPPYLPMIGLVNIIFIGLSINSKALHIYEVSVVAFLILSLLYSMTCRFYEKHTTKSTSFRILLSVLILLSAVVVGWRSGSYWYYHSSQIEAFFSRFDPATTVMNLMPRNRRGVGYSKDTSLGTIPEMQQTGRDKIALHVFSHEKPGYLRGNAYERYSNGSWFSSSDPNLLTESNFHPIHFKPTLEANIFLLDRKHHRVQNWYSYDIWPASSVETAMFSPLGTRIVEAPVKELKCDYNYIFDSDELIGGLNYRVSVPDEPDYPALNNHRKSTYLEVPERFQNDRQIRLLADGLSDHTHSTQKKIKATVDFFKKNYSYHLGVEVPERMDPVVYFLKDKPPAHCEYFASAAALLLRLQNIPTRYVTGFYAGEQNSYLDCWMARNRDAHAWVEAWDDQTGEWVIVEATPPSGLPGGTAQNNNWEYYWDSFLFRLMELRVALYHNGLKGFFFWLSEQLSHLIQMIFSTISGWIFLASLTSLIGTILFVRWSRNREPRPSDLEIIQLQKLLSRLDNRFKQLGYVRGHNETIHQFSARIKDNAPFQSEVNEALSWYQQYARLRYRRQHVPDNLCDLRIRLQNAIKTLPKRPRLGKTRKPRL